MEKTLINVLKRNEAIRGGKCIEYNLWEKDLQKIGANLPRKKEAIYFVIFDTDTCQGTERFIKNVKYLQKNSVGVVLFSQELNLEDELKFSCNKASNNALFKGFYTCRSLSKFKSRFCCDRNLIDTLKKNNFSLALLWSRTQIFGQSLKPLREYKNRNYALLKKCPENI